MILGFHVAGKDLQCDYFPVFLYHSFPPASGLISPARVLKSRNPPELPVEILPGLHICNFDQSPQSVEPVANTTLAPKGIGECVVRKFGQGEGEGRGGGGGKGEGAA